VAAASISVNLRALAMKRPNDAPRSRFIPVLSALALSIPLLSSRAAESVHPIADKTNCELHPALEISLFAREPDVVDPVGLCFDADGRMFVVEMRDYPYGFGPERKPGGTIRLLEDTDGDGKADRSTLFADSLSFPTSITPWNGGVLVTAPPEIIFLKDTNGDGKADVREVILKGFTLGVTDSNLNGLRWGLDNRVHGNNGGNGGNVVSTRKPGPPVEIRNLDFSFDPATGDFTPTGQSSLGFGLVFDDWGRSFATYNINHIQQRMIPERYLRRFAGLPPAETTVNISDHGDMARIYPVSVAETRPNHPEQSGHFSSAGGMGFIGWNGYPGDLPGSILVCDVVGNLVHRDVLKEDGPAFVASRAPGEQTREFLASRDNAFRPVGIELGPDGALYLIDMQRDVIEHPDYIPKKLLDKQNIRAGDDRGRIYRLTPKGGLSAKRPLLNRATTENLVAELSHPNQWRRFTAQRLLVERREKRAVPFLQKMAVESKDPLVRLHGFWILQGLAALNEELILRGLSDPDPGIRENSLLLAEPFLHASKNLSNKIPLLADDSSARVRFQVACTVGQLDDSQVAVTLRRILLRDFGYRWTRLAALSSVRTNAGDLFKSLFANPAFRATVSEPKTDLVRELADLIGARASTSPRDLSAITAVLLEKPVDEKWREAALEGLQSGLTRAGEKVVPTADFASGLERLSMGASPALLAAAWKTARALGLAESEIQRTALAQAMAQATEAARPVSGRVDNVRLLALGGFPAVKQTLLSLLEATQPSAIQQAAVEVLAQFNDTGIARDLVARWRVLVPPVRVPVINLLLKHVSYHPFLVEAIETEKIKLGELNLDLEQRRLLLRESTPEVRVRAARLISDEEYSNRKSVVEEWLKKLPASGEPTRGQAVFEKTCAQCHAVGNIGHHVGPDLTAVAHRSVEDLLSNILDPNMAINPGYATYNCETDSGELETGILQSESPEAITLLQAAEKKVVIPRKKIKRLESSGLSLMPEGLEAGMTPVDLRDLIAFLQDKR
jgi:putative membrane-bound dehydrogenase-like protein